jgi:hypothetical protein
MQKFSADTSIVCCLTNETEENLKRRTAQKSGDLLKFAALMRPSHSPPRPFAEIAAGIAVPICSHRFGPTPALEISLHDAC